MSEEDQRRGHGGLRHPASTTQPDERVMLLGHDLRAAVSDIVGGVRLIDQKALDDATRLQLERIRTASEALARLLEEGLALMLGHDETAPVRPVTIQMSRFLYDLEVRWSGRAREKGLRLSVRVGADLPPVITADRSALERVLANILSNAIKYTDDGEVVLDIRLDAGATLRFEISDSGPGFSSAAMERLFQYQGRPEDTVKPGQGLGMHISKTLTARLGGAISVENGTHGGAVIVLELPRGAWQQVAAETAEDLPDLSRVKVLVAEDGETNQIIIGQMLTQMGAAYEIAADGVEALQWLERENFDIALIDIEMPRLSGIDVIRQLRTNDRLHARMPLVAFTAYVLRANREAIYAAGADTILSKPVTSTLTLGQTILQALAHRPDPGQGEVETAPGTVELDRAQFDHLMEIAGPANVRELLDRLWTDLRRAERALLAGLTAKDRAAIRAESHVLIALAGAVGAERLMRLSETLNAKAHRREDAARESTGAETLAAVDRLITVVATERARRSDGFGETA